MWRKNYTDLVVDFAFFDKHEYSHGICQYILLATIYIYVTGLFNFFFVPQDLIDRINFYFQKIAFQRNLLLIGF